MKVYKNFDEIRGKVKKLPRKYYENFSKNWLVLNITEILQKFWKKSCHSWENLE